MAAQELLTRRQARAKLQAFTEYTTPRWRPGPIHRTLCEQLDRVVAGEVDRMLLLCPPQHGKSQIASKRLPAYVLGKRPTTDVVSVSATAELVDEFGGETRNCISSPEYRALFPATQLAEDTQAKGRWKTRQGGGYYAIGIGGAIMGRGGELGLIDDPFASWEDAQSERSRDRVWDWYTGSLYNRIRPGGAIIVIQHRMHEEDLAGRLIEQMRAGGPDKWVIVEIPADIENPPWPERYDGPALDRIRQVSGPRKWSALYQQKPTPAEGTYFQRDWFRRYVPEQLPKALHRYVTSDHAPAGAESTDANCFRVWGLAGTDVYLLDGFNKHETIDKSMDRMTGVKKDKVTGLLERHKPLAWFPEDDNNWKSVAGFVGRQMRTERVYCRIEPVTPNGRDKAIKAQAFQGLASSGCVWIPAGPEGDEIIEQYVGFPGAKHDDEVDAAAIIGRVIDEAHPALMQAPPTPAVERDRYDREDEEADSWRVA